MSCRPTTCCDLLTAAGVETSVRLDAAGPAAHLTVGNGRGPVVLTAVPGAVGPAIGLTGGEPS
jgi:hypothetical protein